ncbi:hypothetical protein ACSQ67_025141 [Phaseolus vulgaris]
MNQFIRNTTIPFWFVLVESQILQANRFKSIVFSVNRFRRKIETPLIAILPDNAPNLKQILISAVQISLPQYLIQVFSNHLI